MIKEMINLFEPYVPQEEAIAAVSQVLRSRFVGQGPVVDQFEHAFSTKFDLPEYCVSLNSCTSALETAFELIGLHPGDEVISTPLTCTATNLMLLKKGVRIVWADILKNTLCINPDDVRNKMNNRTKAVVQVHLGGISAECHLPRYDITVPIVSDAAQALGIFNGDYTCCSFQAIKHITTGDGGMLVCPTERTRNEAKLLRWFGIDRDKKIRNNWQAYKERKMTFDIKFLGSKRHMTDISAALGLVGLKHYDEVISLREKQFKHYQNELINVPGVQVIDGPENKYWLCTLLVEDRDGFAKKMFESGIDVNLVQVRNDIYKIFGGQRADLPVMNAIEDKYISIPLGCHVSAEEVSYICDTIKGGW